MLSSIGLGGLPPLSQPTGSSGPGTSKSGPQAPAPGNSASEGNATRKSVSPDAAVATPAPDRGRPDSPVAAKSSPAPQAPRGEAAGQDRDREAAAATQRAMFRAALIDRIDETPAAGASDRAAGAYAAASADLSAKGSKVEYSY